MDLKELHICHTARHPWETSRLKALQSILTPETFEGIKVLDVGCGDGFICGSLFGHLSRKEITCVDINLSDEMLAGLGANTQGIRYQREMPADGGYDLVLLLDLLEHIASDKDFLADLVDNYLSKNGKVMITVPAFQSLYGHHDIFLKHYRRYNLNGLSALASSCGLAVISSGYLFFSLLLPKFILARVLNIKKVSHGIGNWNGGRWITTIIEKLLDFDNRLLTAAGRYGIKIPGLTGWMLCEKRGW